MFYTVYKITYRTTGKSYIGTHKTDNLNDGYMGSGVLIRRAIAKHGIEQFDKEILFVYDNPQDMFSKERELVNENTLGPNLYNLKIGGEGGFAHLNDGSELQRLRNSRAGKISARQNPGKLHKYYEAKIASDPAYCLEHNRRVSESLKGRRSSFAGKTHSDESKQKIGLANTGRTGKLNSQFGSCWITKDGMNKKIKRNDLETFMKLGFQKGRIM